MNIIPQITTVAELQRNYRPLINRIKKSNQPLFVLSNGKPDSVLLDIHSFESLEKRYQSLEESYLMALTNEALKESRSKQTIVMKEGQTLLDIIDSDAN